MLLAARGHPTNIRAGFHMWSNWRTRPIHSSVMDSSRVSDTLSLERAVNVRICHLVVVDYLVVASLLDARLFGSVWHLPDLDVAALVDGSRQVDVEDNPVDVRPVRIVAWPPERLPVAELVAPRSVRPVVRNTELDAWRVRAAST